MLELTPTAAEVVNAIVSQQELPETGGMRITSEEATAASDGSGPVRDIRLSVVDGPEGDDQAIDGAPVYIESGTTAEMLEDKLLDAAIEGQEVSFRLTLQG
jgi:hypothetical protein